MEDKPPRKIVVVKGTVTRMPTSICIGKAVAALASHWIFVSMRPRPCRAELSIPLSPFSAQRQTMAVMVSETAHGSMMMTRATERP